MNFKTEVSTWNMPELGWHFGYPFALGIMAGTAGVLLYFFYRKGWLTRPKAGSERRPDSR
jgi:magnesium transporter